ncbi:hypothetical protein [Methanogenium cariaci]|uniref:hypothetical protein n=1 Tax=Methanogenium cariaci TaxID=2197 RepID=UPI0012F653B6|nr:hypothetical protein [Methanogenium cariaci]
MSSAAVTRNRTVTPEKPGRLISSAGTSAACLKIIHGTGGHKIKAIPRQTGRSVADSHHPQIGCRYPCGQEYRYIAKKE